MTLKPASTLKVAVVFNLGLVACLADSGDPVTPASGGSGGSGATGGSVTAGTGGTGGSVTAGTGGTGGSVTAGTGGTGGSVTAGTGGTTGGTTGGLGATGGMSGSTAAGTGGVAASSGSGGVGGSAGAGANGGDAGMSGSGGSTMAGMGGMSGGGATGGGAGMTGGAGTGGGSGECVKGQTKGDQVAMIGESFIAATHQITQQVEARAKAAGSLAQSERYVDNSRSGTTLANNQIPSQYTSAQASNDIKYVLMDGGGNDCWILNDGPGALAAAESLFATMTQDGVEKVVYFFYPDPIGANFANLKTCLDQLRPQMKALCDGLTSPKCYWLDLRETWNGHGEYTADGIHPTTEGSKATGDAIWEVMEENCVAQ